MAIGAAREWSVAQAKAPKGPSIATPPLAMVRTECPTIKTDAAWNETHQMAGLGWIIEDNDRVSSYSAPARFVASPLVAEALAIREALMKCREIGLAKIRCESDSAILVKAINAGNSLAGLYGILSDISAFASSFESISFCWISREKNSVADRIAKQILDVELAIMAPPNFG